MPDLTIANSGYAAGSLDTARTLQNGVDQKRAEHINGPNTAIIQMQSVMGAGPTLKGTAPDLATRLAVSMLPSGQLSAGVPVGAMFAYGGAAAPVGYLLCDGGTFSDAAFPLLAAVVGTAYGPAVSGTHTLPDKRGRVSVGAGAGTGLTNRTRGVKLGEEGHSLTIQEIPAHVHTVIVTAGAAGLYAGGPIGPTAGNTGSTGGGAGGTADPHNTMQPSETDNWIIKTD